jgi:hypothetical protein
MMQIEGTITTKHHNAECVAAALAPDNLRNMTTTASLDRVTTTITGTHIRSVIASVDDYLTMLAIADDVCSCSSQKPHIKHERTGQETKQEEQSSR